MGYPPATKTARKRAAVRIPAVRLPSGERELRYVRRVAANAADEALALARTVRARRRAA